MKKRSNLTNSVRHCGLDPQSPANKAFNKEMLKQVQHDGRIFRRFLLVFIILLLSIPCLTAQNTGYMGKRVIFNMGAEFSPAWIRPVCDINFNNKYLRFNTILSPNVEVIVHKRGTAGVAYHYLKTKYNVPYTKDYYDTSYFGNDGMYIVTSDGEFKANLIAHGFGVFYKQYMKFADGRSPVGPYIKLQFDGFFFKCPVSYSNRTTTINDQLFAMKVEIGNDFLLFDRLRLSTGFSLGVPFGGYKALGYDLDLWGYNEEPYKYARSRIFGTYWLGFTVNIGFLAF